jgi:CheY-like chemotaxis protein
MPYRKAILVAEDSREDQFILKRAFAKAGVTTPIIFVHDGQEAIDYLSSDERPCPRVMLLDLKMPKLDGFDVLRWLQQQDGLRRLIVTILSSSDHDKDVNRAYDLGANSYVVKPSSAAGYDDIAEKVRSYWLEFNQPPECSRRR